MFPSNSETILKKMLGLEQKQRQGSITENPAEYWEWKLTG